MSSVHLKNGLAETALAKRLWHKGVRYRKNCRQFPGSPDIALTKFKVAVFIDGEFWHGYDWENQKARLKSNRDYWTQKIEENIARDACNDRLLNASGWTVIHLWEKEVRRDLVGCVEKVMRAVKESQV